MFIAKLGAAFTLLATVSAIGPRPLDGSNVVKASLAQTTATAKGSKKLTIVKHINNKIKRAKKAIQKAKKREHEAKSKGAHRRARRAIRRGGRRLKRDLKKLKKAKGLKHSHPHRDAALL
jgi:hypothetical protein